MTETAPPVAGPEAAPSDSPKRQQILDGARRMFLAKGFEGASMQDLSLIHI
mgnify:FL=1